MHGIDMEHVRASEIIVRLFDIAENLRLICSYVVGNNQKILCSAFVILNMCGKRKRKLEFCKHEFKKALKLQ